MREDIVIRSVENDQDIDNVAILANQIWTEHYVPIIGEEQVDYMLYKFQSAETVTEQIQEGYKYHLLTTGDLISNIGYFSYRLESESLFLSKLYVLKPYRKLGLARKSLLFLEDTAREAGLFAITLTVNKENVGSIKAYERLGFDNIDSVVMDIGNGFVMDDYVLRKSIG